jgi:hypothetical protein
MIIYNYKHDYTFDSFEHLHWVTWCCYHQKMSLKCPKMAFFFSRKTPEKYLSGHFFPKLLFWNRTVTIHMSQQINFWPKISFHPLNLPFSVLTTLQIKGFWQEWG